MYMNLNIWEFTMKTNSEKYSRHPNKFCLLLCVTLHSVLCLTLIKSTELVIGKVSETFLLSTFSSSLLCFAKWQQQLLKTDNLKTSFFLFPSGAIGWQR